MISTGPKRRGRRKLRVLLLALALVGCGHAKAPPVEAARIAELLLLQPGMKVADVGAGDGEFTEDLATRVGEGGHVYSTEVKEDQLEDIRERVEDAELENVTVIEGNATDTGLPDGCCDAILLRLVYHHFTDPAEMRASLRKALRPEARLLVIDTRPHSLWPELAGVPDRGGHGISLEDLLEEMTSDGFEVVEKIDVWDGDGDEFCVVFQR